MSRGPAFAGPPTHRQPFPLCHHHLIAPISLVPTVSEVIRTLISVYKDLFKVPALSDAVMFQHFAQTVLVVDEVCKEVSALATKGQGL